MHFTTKRMRALFYSWLASWLPRLGGDRGRCCSNNAGERQVVDKMDLTGLSTCQCCSECEGETLILWLWREASTESYFTHDWKHFHLARRWQQDTTNITDNWHTTPEPRYRAQPSPHYSWLILSITDHNSEKVQSETEDRAEWDTCH